MCAPPRHAVITNPTKMGYKENIMKTKAVRRIWLAAACLLVFLLVSALSLTVGALEDKNVTEVNITVSGYEIGANIADITAEIVKAGDVGQLAPFPIRGEAVDQALNVKVGTFVLLEFLDKAADVVVVRMGEDPGGNMPAVKACL